MSNAEKENSIWGGVLLFGLLGWFVGGWLLSPDLPPCDEPEAYSRAVPEILGQYLASEGREPTFVTATPVGSGVGFDDGVFCLFNIRAFKAETGQTETGTARMKFEWSFPANWIWPLRFDDSYAYVKLNRYERRP